MSEVINVAFTSDKHYFAKLAVAVMSIKNNVAEGSIHIYVLTEEENRDSVDVQRIKRMCRNNFKITFLYVDTKVFEGYEFNNHSGTHLTMATMYRLLLGKLLPKNVEKLLFLDTDMLICTDLHELYAEDVEGYLMGVVAEDAEEDRIFIKQRCSYMFQYYEDEEELYRTYFNAGMLLINMVEFRRQRISQQCIQLLMEHPEFVCFDQDALNVICKGKVKFLEPKWNRIWRRELADGSPGTGCLAETMDDIKIIHYCTGAKPWSDPEFKLTNRFMETVYDTEWYPEIIDEMKNTMLHRVFMYKFPWNQIDAGDQILIYGAGEVGDRQIYQMQLTGYCTVKAVIDKDAAIIGSIRNIPAISLEELKEIYEAEKIVIAILKDNIRLDIKDSLIKIGIPEENIIWDYKVK